ncbi:MAG: NADP-dependent isocitrate dehydrogenase [Myxococcales bacterium]|jgi:isocitrate dehydrogenase|nr:NADP-dependent isocitrate dehydrogenase [Myxococcales bacterium]
MRYKLDSNGRKRVTLIAGDGIGPEVANATRRIVDATGVKIAWEEREAGAEVFKRGLPSGVPPETIASIKETRVALKGPLETPIGFGEKSANVTLRKLFETYANVRPVRELPGVKTPFAGRGVDLVVVRENVEDLYAGIEHMQTPGVAQCLKLMSKKGCERIVRLAFEVAVAEGRKKVHCATKANIMKLTEGLMKRTFEEVAKEYPRIEASHIIIDNCAHQVVRTPEQFDVIVTSNMNGDILSDLTSGLIGGLGFAPGANLGDDVAIFEAVHGSAPKYAGKNVINPSAVLLSATMMLRHLDEFAAAQAIESALVVTLEEGVFTRDVSPAGSVSTTAFTDRIIANLGKRSERWRSRDHKALRIAPLAAARDYVRPKSRRTVGADVFVESPASPDELGRSLEAIAEGSPLRLKMISNRGTKVYPNNGGMTDCVDHWRCRFVLRDGAASLDDAALLRLVGTIATAHRWMHLEKLEELDGEPAFTRAQGED